MKKIPDEFFHIHRELSARLKATSILLGPVISLVFLKIPTIGIHDICRITRERKNISFKER